jgi:eukaryotic-like serine/threonine-protein kinase
LVATVNPPPPPILAQRYRLDRRVATGGMAEVWLATDELLARQVAVKLLKPTLAADPVIAERFRREAIAVAQLTHPNVVAVYDTVDEGGRQAVVMQYVPGRSLRQLLDDERKLSPERTIQIGAAVAAALGAAHDAGMVHRDVKPGNILITPEGRVLLADFGIAKAVSGEEDLTSDNVMMGTAKYLSPEQVRGRRLDGRADLYSLGLVLYECLAGRVPFQADTDAATALARLQRDPTPLLRLRPTLPAGLVELIHRLLARNPDDRPASSPAVQATLERILTHANSHDETGAFPPPLPPAPPPPSTPVMITPATAAVSPPAATGLTATPGRGGPRTRPDTPPAGRPAAPRAPVTPAAGLRDPLLSGSVPQVRPYTPSRGTPQVSGVGAGRSPVPPPLRPRDPTPSSRAMHGRPARQFQQRWGPSMVIVGGLLIVALVLGVILLNSIGTDNSNANEATSTLSLSSTAPTTPPTTDDGIPAAMNDSAAQSFDPKGDPPNEEFNDLIPLMFDGSESTAWHTSCYDNQYTGSKKGTGVVVPLTEPGTGTLTVIFAAKPWSARVFFSDAIPTSIEGWGPSMSRAFSSEEFTGIFLLGAAPHTYALVWLEELAPNSDPCSNKRPWRGEIAEIVFTPGPGV